MGTLKTMDVAKLWQVWHPGGKVDERVVIIEGIESGRTE
jgi:hypothetical protein